MEIAAAIVQAAELEVALIARFLCGTAKEQRK
jgi:hypothetical protein